MTEKLDPYRGMYPLFNMWSAGPMWFVADVFERYTTNVARSFLKIAAQEAEANRKALEAMRARRLERKAQLEGECAVEISTPAPTKLAPVRELPKETAEVVVLEERKAAPAPAAAATAEVIAFTPPAAERKGADEFPMGIRGDVVVQWVQTFDDAARADVADLVEKLRKDKKVRVAELQHIVAEVLGETATFRKKADHLTALGEYLAPGMRPAAQAPANEGDDAR